MRFMVFDLPGDKGTFDQRLPALNALVESLGQPWVQAVPQRNAWPTTPLQALLHRTVRAGGEGLMLHRGASLYRAGRSDDLIKVKTHEDTEARVVAHLPGKGRHAGTPGRAAGGDALGPTLPAGRRFQRCAPRSRRSSLAHLSASLVPARQGLRTVHQAVDVGLEAHAGRTAVDGFQNRSSRVRT
jgi:hypothetical protein